MNKEGLLKELATNGYNVGFGAKKHFATYDIISKVPGIISLIGLFIGIGQLAYPHYHYSTGISTILIMASILGLTMSTYNSEKESYNQTGVALTELYNRLRVLYESVFHSSSTDFTAEIVEMNQIMNEYYSTSKSQQIFGSDWYAHYKFFFQMQIQWVHEQKKFTWRDKIPGSFIFFLITMVLVLYAWYYIFVRNVGGV